VRAIGALFLILIVGSGGYLFIEGWSLVDSFYMTVITLSTVGFQEVQPLSEMGRAFTALLIFLGISAFGYAFGSIVAFFVEGELVNLIRSRKMGKIIETLQDHIIICGHGSEGSHAAAELQTKKVQIVIIEKDEVMAEKLTEDGLLVIAGDATEDDILIRAGVSTAKGLIAAVSEDMQNVFVTLTARGFNPNLTIVSKASEEGSVAKLYRAGANKVISSAEIGGRRMASVLIRPTTVNFLDVIASDQELSLRLEEILITEISPFDGRSILDLHIRAKTGVLVIGYARQGQKIKINPEAGTVLQAGDLLIVLGNDDQLSSLQKLTMTNFTS